MDRDDRMIALAASRRPNADFRIGDALDLPFADGELNGYRAEKLYHELPDPARAVAEARRVLAPGGRIVLIGQDWDTLVLDSDHPGLTRTIVHARADTIASPRAARRYRALLLDAGFTDLTTEVHTAVFTDPALLPMATAMADSARTTGAITPAQAAAWTADQTARAETGRFFLAVPLFVTAATRPRPRNHRPAQGLSASHEPPAVPAGGLGAGAPRTSTATPDQPVPQSAGAEPPGGASAD
ncbi:SAM-dependent methyltransferase [Actinomadura cellulosilytica]|uniref:SAM-dependent methyltransferase n=1 Tax=Thermomonospora cellulosilytica TaxID=1411118 RepID=A0A7W3R8F4_9ACTN|nr:SAM-dependent methyltransferase [Thermomonospora cellulosilytica]